MKAVLFVVLLTVVGVQLNAQTKAIRPIQASHALSQNRFETSTFPSYRDTVRILAVMIDFQVDNDTRTSGSGKYLLQSYVAIPDPPPHNASYFNSKIQFVRNYFRKVSNGKLTIVATLLPQVITVSQQMQAYAPPPGSNNKGLANLAYETWRLTDSVYAGLPFNQFDAFLIFHAGVGHDISIVNILGYDPTPFDLPSLYLGPRAFKDAFQDQSFSGIPVNGGSYKITNTMILPESDTYTYMDSQGFTDTVKVSINGLFAASIGSYLGLPDLWNTKTGREGIGQYGLEDGASMFAFYGLFPPEPSAWEKIRLGWVTPITISTTTQDLPAPAVSLYHTSTSFFGQDTIYKIPINAKEYFLVENRSRDPLKNGQTLTILQNGLQVSQTFTQDVTGFNNNDIELIGGSVIDADDFDWALLGYIDSTGLYEGGGILIWHIDEDVISAGLATNTVNADPITRGVYLEEAKGAQDIGQTYEYLTGGYASQNGNPLNPWFLGNSSPTYTNRFDRNSIPNSNTNSGALSLISIKDFSARLARMTFSVQFGDDYLKPIPGFPKYLGVSSSDRSVQAWTNGVFVSKGDSLYVFRSDGSSGVPDPSGLLSPIGGKFPAAFLSGPPNTFFVGVKDSSAVVIKVVDANSDGVFDSVQTTLVNVGHRITTESSVSGTNIVLGHADGGVVQLNPLTGQVSAVITGMSGSVQSVVAGDFAVTSSGIKDASNRTYTFSSPFSGFATGYVGANVIVVDTTRRTMLILKNDLTFLAQASLSRWSGSISKPVAADILHNGDQSVILSIGNSVVALNSSGFPLDGFPLKIAGAAGSSAPPLVRSFTSNGAMNILTASSTGLISGYDNRGRQLSGFPIDIRSGVSGSLAAFPVSQPSSVSQAGVSLFTDDGLLYAFQISVPFVPVDQGPPVAISNDFFPASRVYNWPNPVYGSSTQIRYYSAQDANIAITVFDIAGSKIAELNGKATGGLDGEITWDVTHIQSGVYLARVEASNQAQTQARIVKIAVVK